jgi:beta-lactam-binding protein with PASTA domain
MANPIMPALIGQQYWDAQQLLQNAGVFSPKSLGFFGTFPIYASWQKSSAPPGTVLAQSIQAGVPTAPNSQVILTMSEFPMGVSFPTLPAPPVTGGVNILTDSGLQITTDDGKPILTDSVNPTPPATQTWTADSTTPTIDTTGTTIDQ